MKLSQILGSTLGAFIALIIFSVLSILLFIGFIGGLASEAQMKPTIDTPSVLQINLDRPIIEKSSRHEWQGFNFDKLKPIHHLGLNELKLAINKATSDENIEAILLEVNMIDAGLAMINEIGESLKTFKASGKKIYAYGEVFNEKAFYLSTYADETYLNPAGFMEFNGWAVEILYFKNMLKKIGVEPELFRVGKFKSAMEPFILEGMSDASREQLSRYINSIYSSVLNDIAENTEIGYNKLKTTSDSMLVRLPAQALEAGLIEGTLYYDELLEKMPSDELLSLEDYLDIIADDVVASANRVAIVVAQGQIVDGSGDKDQIGGTALSETLRKVRKDSTIKAVVLRVNSPGGSALASDIIWREVKLIAEEKPIIASMSDVAASGGYYISMPATKIVANEKTITGSIGVFGLLINAKELLNDKLGITTDKVTTGVYSNLGSITNPVTESEAAIIQSSVDSIYSTFITKAAEGRGMTKEEIHEIAQGRVWSGTDALGIGLVDTLGTLETAIAIAAQEAGLETYSVEYYPKKKHWLERLLNTEELEAQYIESHFKTMAPYLEALKQVQNLQGAQARMPYLLNIE